MNVFRYLSQDVLKEHLHYSSETGIFIRKITNSNRAKVGDIAGCKDSDGYISIGINGKQYKAHRLAWLYMTGELPKDMIDHKDGVRDNNRFDNLRQATNGQNLQNQIKPHNNNTTGFLGVSFNKINRNYAAHISIDGKLTYIGSFATPEEASEAYLTKKRETHEFCTI